jgi:Zn-dependent peptidase ImmA (M78 family)
MTDMAKYFGVSEAVIRKHFTQTVIQTQTKVKQRIRQKQVSMALAGDKTLLIWLGKNYLDQSDNGVKNDDAKQPLPWDDE